MVIFIYDKEILLSGNIFYYCLSIKFDNNKNITDYRYIFKELKPNEDIKNYWNWFFPENKDKFFIYNEALTIDFYQKYGINSETIDNLLYEFDQNFQLEFNERNKDIEIPRYIYFNSNDIKSYLPNDILENEISFAFNLQRNLLLLKIVSFFSEHEHLLFEFPLYQEFILENDLSQEEYQVEDFIDFLMKTITKFQIGVE